MNQGTLGRNERFNEVTTVNSNDIEPTSGVERVLIAAFGGWSDAGNAATTTIDHLRKFLRVETLHVISADGYVDFQMHRPQMVQSAEGGREIQWPDSEFFGPIFRPGEDPLSEEELQDTVRTLDGEPVSSVFLLQAIEPAQHWSQYVDEILDFIDTWDIDLVICVGSYFSDSPHSRPIITALTSDDAGIRQRFDAERSDYEGPIGISAYAMQVFAAAEVPTVALWAQVPHYVHSAPSPKATLALLDKCEELLNVVIPRGDLLTEANEWEQNIDDLAGQDDEMRRYIQRLEEARDTFDGPKTTGDAIAYELEKYLRIRPDSPEDPQPRDTEE